MTLPAYPEYRDSGVDWLGEIPGHWEVKPLKHWVAINSVTLTENTHPNFLFTYFDIGTIGTGVLLRKPQKMYFKDAPSRARRVVRSGDTIISTVRTYLKAVYYFPQVDEDIIASTGFAVLSPSEKIVPQYLSFLVQSNPFTDSVTAYSVGIAYPAIRETDLGRFAVPLPPPDEQAAIVRFLDAAEGRIRRYIRAKQKLIKLLNEQKQAIIQQAVTRGLDPDVPMKDSGVEWLGEIPAHWEVKRLKSIAKIRYGLGQPPREKENGLPLIRATNINRGKISETNMIFVDPDDVPKTRNAFLDEHEIIVVRSGAYTADSAIIPLKYKGAVTGYDMVVTVTAQDPKFISYALLASYVLYDQLIIASLRAAQPHLNASELGEASIILPSVEEQSYIAKHVELGLLEIDTTIDLQKRNIDLIREYRTRLIADVVTGKVDVRGLAFEMPEEFDDDDLLDVDEDDLLEEDDLEGMDDEQPD